jgi:D-tyrosyl-tRNA(Tyr) deacylase
MKDAEEADVEKLVKAVLNVRLSESEDDPNKHISILDLPGSILIIPQATLGGRMKGKMIQYHNNVNKDKGLALYELFINLCKKYTSENEKWSKSINECKIKSGTYGIRQVYSTETNGPYLHMIEF